MKYVYLAQLKCPANHCVLAAANEFENKEAAKTLGVLLEQKLAELVNNKKLRSGTCAICGSHVLGLYIGRTPYHTMAEALPILKAMEHQRRITAELLLRRN